MFTRLTALTIAATMFASSASAYDPDHLQRLKGTGNCERCDLRDANLAQQFLVNAYLTATNLAGANLAGANLKGAWLAGANLAGANLGGANLEGANLGYVYMNGAILCNTTMPDGSVIYSGC